MDNIQVRKKFSWPQFIVYVLVGAVLGAGASHFYDISFWAVFVAIVATFSLYYRKDIYFEERKISDPFFGDLLFMQVPKPNQSYWEGAALFEPTQTKIEYMIDADENGPEEPQRAFYREFVQNYPDIRETIMPLLHRRFLDNESGEQWIEPHIVGVSIPLNDTPDCEWAMSFEHAEPVGNPYYDVQMKGWRPTGEIVNE